MKKILAFAGSNSSTSINHQLILATSKLTSKANIEVISLRDYEAPVFGVDLLALKGMPESMTRLSKKMKTADGFIVSFAEHNGSMTAAVKSAFDWLSKIEGKFFLDKPVVFLATSNGARGGASALKHVVEIMPYRGAKIIGNHSIGGFEEKVVNGEIINETDKKRIQQLLSELTDSL